MKKLRIRNIYSNGNKSDWLYSQDQVKNKPGKIEPAAFTSQSKTSQKYIDNQYGRFKYSEEQYGKVPIKSGSIEIDKRPMRIRSNKSQFVYSQNTEINRDCTAIRIRSVGTDKSPWVYLDRKEI